MNSHPVKTKEKPGIPFPRIKSKGDQGNPTGRVSLRPNGATFYGKRFFDVVVSTLLLILLSPFLGIITLAIVLDSPGMPLFRHRRVGWKRRPFWMMKFRTMVHGAEGKRADTFRQLEDAGLDFKLKKDPRLTRLGGFLRKFSLDELPQLINVLLGDMSLVGPRPHSMANFERPFEDEPLKAIWVVDRHQVRPGMTGLWQISGRNNLALAYRIHLDLRYVREGSWAMDLDILLKTFLAVIKHDGAY
ncbi:MAG: sugar transferase [Elusimicrobia bacterium]|nr:sugar transferase [Elusimicrobiota bacterium]